MATQTKRGWIWTEAERESIKSWQGPLRRRHSQLNEQVRRFHDSVPQYAEEAAATAQRYLETARALQDLDARRSGRQYQPMSPEEAQAKLAELQSHLQVWNTFMTRADVAQAIREANQGIRRDRREYEEAVRDARDQFIERIDCQEYRDQLDATVEELIASAYVYAHAGDLRAAPNKAEVQRLILVRAINSARFLLPAKGQELASFLTGSPPPSIKAVLKHTLYLTTRHETLDRLDRARCHPEFLQFPHTNPILVSCLGSAAVSLADAIRQSPSKTIEPSEEDFRIMGFDYSLEARPD